MAAPAISMVSPVEGAIGGGNVVTITGTNLTSAQSVTFGGTPGTGVTVDSAGTSLTVTTPAHATAGVVDVAVITLGGAAVKTGGFTYQLPAPTISSVSPAQGTTNGGDTVTLAGANLDAVTSVTFGGTAGTAITVNGAGTLLTVNTPAHPAGAVDVTVTTPGGTATAATQFTYLGEPTIASVSPKFISPKGGQAVTITGANLATIHTVKFDGTPGTNVGYDSATGHLTVTAPAHQPGVVGISVFGPGGSVGGVDDVTYADPPTITSVSPSTGTTLGGTPVTIIGTELSTAKISVGGKDPVVTFKDFGEIDFVAPPHTQGPVTITASGPGGDATLANAFTYVAPPTITSVTPLVDYFAGGTTVTLKGERLATTSSVKFGAKTAVITSKQDTQLTVTVPAQTPMSTDLKVDLEITSDYGTTTIADGFTYKQNRPSFYAVTPDNGTTSGNTEVVISGQGLGNATVRFGNDPGTVISSDETELHVITPPHVPAGQVSVTVSNPSGTATAQTAYTYTPAALVLGPPILPDAIVGEDYNEGFGLEGGYGTVSYSLKSGTLPDGLNLTVDGQLSGKPTASALGDHAFTIEAKDQLGQTASATYLVTVLSKGPSISMISPPDGTTNGGTSVTIDGDDLAGATVQFGNDAGTVTSNTGTKIVVKTPPHVPAEPVTVTVTTAAGSTTTSFTYIAAVLSFTPAAGDLPDATVGVPYSQQVTMSGGFGTVTYSLGTTTLPSGLSLDTASGPDLRHTDGKCPECQHHRDRHGCARPDGECGLHHHRQGRRPDPGLGLAGHRPGQGRHAGDDHRYEPHRRGCFFRRHGGNGGHGQWRGYLAHRQHACPSGRRGRCHRDDPRRHGGQDRRLHLSASGPRHQYGLAHGGPDHWRLYRHHHRHQS